MSMKKSDFKDIKKDELIDMYIKLHNDHEAQVNFNDKLDAIFNKIDKVTSELAVTKNVNDLLLKRIKDLEVRISESEQYSRRECLEITGIPESADDGHLETKVLELFEDLSVNIDERNVEACHKVGQNGRVIIKLSKRKDVHAILANKKKLKELDTESKGFEKKVYINESLCKTYRSYWYKCKLLHKKGHIFSFWTSNGHVKLRVADEGKVHCMLHESDFHKLFPLVDFSTLAED